MTLRRSIPEEMTMCRFPLLKTGALACAAILCTSAYAADPAACKDVRAAALL